MLADDFDTGPASIDVQTNQAMLKLPNGDAIKKKELAQAQSGDGLDQIGGSIFFSALFLGAGGFASRIIGKSLTNRRIVRQAMVESD